MSSHYDVKSLRIPMHLRRKLNFTYVSFSKTNSLSVKTNEGKVSIKWRLGLSAEPHDLRPSWSRLPESRN